MVVPDVPDVPTPLASPHLIPPHPALPTPAAHRATVMGLVGLTFAGGYTIFSGISELRTKRLANAEAAAASAVPVEPNAAAVAAVAAAANAKST